MPPKSKAPRDNSTPAPGTSATHAVAWAISQRPEKWSLGEWLGRLLPEGEWAAMEDDAIADQVVGACIRAREEEPEG